MKIYFFYILSFLIGLSSCADGADDQRDQIITYLNDNGLEWQETTDGLFVVITQAGSETKPTLKSTVTLRYTAKYTDGVVFDQSPPNQVALLNLSTAIKGLKSGIPLFGKNGEGMIIIPSTLGYGNNPPFGVRKNAILIYAIEVLDF